MRYQEFRNLQYISQGRKRLFYGGMVLITVGILAFLPMFVRIATILSRSADIGEGPGFMRWGIIGFVLMLTGAVMRGIGSRGLEGSVMVRDPEWTREEPKTYSNTLGSMARNAMEGFREAGVKKEKEVEVRVMLRCRSCRALGSEEAKFCDQCGAEL
jgi:hypothetical protein